MGSLLAIIINQHLLKQLFYGPVLALSLSIGLQMECTTESQSDSYNGKQKLQESEHKVRVQIMGNIMWYT